MVAIISISGFYLRVQMICFCKKLFTEHGFSISANNRFTWIPEIVFQLLEKYVCEFLFALIWILNLPWQKFIELFHALLTDERVMINVLNEKTFSHLIRVISPQMSDNNNTVFFLCLTGVCSACVWAVFYSSLSPFKGKFQCLLLFVY